MIKVKRPVLIKMILTEKVRTQLQEDYQNRIRRLETEMEQLHFQSKKLLQDAAKKGPEAHKVVYNRLQQEEKARKEKIKQFAELLSQLSVLPEGSEMVHSELETEVEVKVGDRWDKLIGKAEVIVSDGVIVEIRSEGD